MTDPTVSGRLAYLTGVYPAASHTFIQREIAALRAAGARITIASVRQPGAGELIGPEEEAAREETFYVLAVDPARRRAMGQAGRAKVCAEFDIDREAVWLKALFDGQGEDRLRPDDG